MKSVNRLREIAAAMRRCREEGGFDSSYLRDWADGIEGAVEQLGNEAVDREIDAAMAETDANVMRGVARELAGMVAPGKVWLVMRYAGEDAFENSTEILHVCGSLDAAKARMEGDMRGLTDQGYRLERSGDGRRVSVDTGKWRYEYWIDGKEVETDGQAH